MKSHCLFFTAVDEERRKAADIPAQREAETTRFLRGFWFWFAVGWSIGVGSVLAWMSARGGR